MEVLGRYVAKMAGKHPLPAPPEKTFAILGGVGSMVAIGVTGGLTHVTDTALLMAPFGASCFLAFAVPESPLAQPRNIVGGHLISTAVGLIVLSLLGNGWWAMAIAVGLAVTLMQLTRTGHAPAGGDPIVVAALQPGWDFLAFPVGAGAILIALVAVLFEPLRKQADRFLMPVHRPHLKIVPARRKDRSVLLGAVALAREVVKR